MKKLFIIILCLSIGFVVNAQNVKRAYKFLEKLEYQRAKEQLDKEYSSYRNNPAILFGKCVLAADEKSPYYNIMEAWSLAKEVEKNLNQLSPDESEIISEYFVNTEVRRSSWPVKRKMLHAMGAIEAKLITKVREENNLQLTYEVLEKFPDFRYYDNVVHIRNQLEFRKYEKQNTLKAFLEFLEKFPEAAQVQKAIKHRNRLAFKEAQKINTVEAYEAFINKYPDAIDVGAATKLRNAAAFAFAKQQNTIMALENFIRKYPDALEIGEARNIQRQLLYEQAKRIKTLEAYNNFIKKYPDGVQYIDIFNLKSQDLGKNLFRRTLSNWNNVIWTRSFDNNNNIDYASGIANSLNGNYVIAGTTQQSDTSIFRDAWIIQTDKDGKMIWNKNVGGIYNDTVIGIKINSLGEIIVFGKTYLSPNPNSWDGWLFKLGSDGKKIWNRTIGKWNFNDFDVMGNNDIIIGGYNIDDSLTINYKLLVLNNKGRKMWDRVYTGYGSVNAIEKINTNEFILGGSGWIAALDSKGYIKWEQMLPVSDSITILDIGNNQDFYVSGKRDSTILFLAKFNINGNKLWEKAFSILATSYDINKFCSGNSGNFLTVNTINNSSQSFAYFDSMGNKTDEKILSPIVRCADIKQDYPNNNLVLLSAENNIVLVKISGIP